LVFIFEIYNKGATPIEKNVIVVDEKGNEYERTYPKRARGLVKNGRARFIDENTICLACPPVNISEDIKMLNDKIIAKAKAKTRTIYLSIFVPITVLLLTIIAILSVIVIIKFENPTAFFAPDYFIYDGERYYTLDALNYDYEQDEYYGLVAMVAVINGDTKGEYIGYLSKSIIDGKELNTVFIPSQSATYVNSILYSTNQSYNLNMK